MTSLASGVTDISRQTHVGQGLRRGTAGAGRCSGHREHRLSGHCHCVYVIASCGEGDGAEYWHG